MSKKDMYTLIGVIAFALVLSGAFLYGLKKASDRTNQEEVVNIENTSEGEAILNELARLEERQSELEEWERVLEEQQKELEEQQEIESQEIEQMTEIEEQGVTFLSEENARMALVTNISIEFADVGAWRQPSLNGWNFRISHGSVYSMVYIWPISTAQVRVIAIKSSSSGFSGVDFYTLDAKSEPVEFKKSDGVAGTKEDQVKAQGQLEELYHELEEQRKNVATGQVSTTLTKERAVRILNSTPQGHSDFRWSAYAYPNLGGWVFVGIPASGSGSTRESVYIWPISATQVKSVNEYSHSIFGYHGSDISIHDMGKEPAEVTDAPYAVPRNGLPDSLVFNNDSGNPYIMFGGIHSGSLIVSYNAAQYKATMHTIETKKIRVFTANSDSTEIREVFVNTEIVLEEVISPESAGIPVESYYLFVNKDGGYSLAVPKYDVWNVAADRRDVMVEMLQ